MLTPLHSLDLHLTSIIASLPGSKAARVPVEIILRGWGAPLLVLWYLLTDSLSLALWPWGIGLLLVASISEFGLKRAIKRQRPHGSSVHTFAFPSTHALSVGYLAALAWFLPPQVAVVALLYMVLVCTARVYIGFHFVSDVLAGALLGLVSSSLILNLIF